MASKAQKIRVGVFAAVTAALLVLVIAVFAGIRFWEGRDRYHIVFEETVMGLEDGANVFLNGIRVGAVDDISIDPHDLRKVRVSITVREGTPVRVDTHAMLQLAGITGLKVIDLRDGSLAAPVLPVGGTIPAGETTLDRLEQQAQQLADQSVQLMTRANQIVDNLVAISDPARFAAMDEIVHQAKLTADNLATASKLLEGMVAENRTALRASVVAVEHTARSASAMLDGEVAGLVTDAGDFVAELKGMVRANEGVVRAAVSDLREASRTLKDLAREVRQQPSRLLFSSSPAERKLP